MVVVLIGGGKVGLGFDVVKRSAGRGTCFVVPSSVFMRSRRVCRVISSFEVVEDDISVVVELPDLEF